MKKTFLILSLVLLLTTGFLTSVSGQNEGDAPDTDAVNDLLSAGSQTVTLGDVLMNEAFDNNQDWPEWDDDGTSAFLRKGVYYMTVDGNFYSWQLSPDSYQDVVIQVEAEPVSKSASNEYGLTCRSATSTGTGYYFLISGDGYYTILKLSDPDDGRQELVEWNTSDFINQGRDSNTITAVCVGDYLALYANGHLLAETTDDEFPEGYAGLTLGGYEDDATTEVAFDNLAIWEASAGKGGLSKGTSAAVTLENYDGEPEAAVAELR
ncbi:MAG: hypothetical protein K8I30_04650, partial [Anaerolineae bacterium]|nr:hypothetical protein [Anaerolineae bacterium]